MRHDVGLQVVGDVIREIESACGGKVPDARRNEVVQKVNRLLSDVPERQRPIEHKQVSILLSDLRGFTSLTEHCSATEVIELLNRYLSRMCEVIFRYNGTIDK